MHKSIHYSYKLFISLIIPYNKEFYFNIMRKVVLILIK